MNEREKLILSENEKTCLSPFILTMQNLMVYQKSKIKEILNQIKTGDNQNLQKWKEEMNNAIFAMNEEKYAELLNLVEKDVKL